MLKENVFLLILAKELGLLENCGYNCTFCSVSLQEDSPRYHSVVRKDEGGGGDGFNIGKSFAKFNCLLGVLLFVDSNRLVKRYSKRLKILPPFLLTLCDLLACGPSAASGSANTIFAHGNPPFTSAPFKCKCNVQPLLGVTRR